MELAVTLVIVLANVILGLFIILKNPKSSTHRLLAFLSLIFAAWTYLNYLSLNAPNADSALKTIRLVMALVIFKTPILFLIVHTFPENSIKLKRRFLAILIILPVVAAALSLSPFLFTHLETTGDQIKPVPGPAMPVWALTFFGFLIISIALLIKRYKRETGVLKSQLKFMLLGFVLSFTFFLVTNFVLVNVFNISSFVFLGPLFTVILIGSIFYSIVRHRFLDITALVVRTVSYAFVLFILVALYAFLIFAATKLIPLEINETILSVLAAMIIAFSFGPLRRILEVVTDRVLFQRHYETEELLSDLTKIMASEIEIKKLSNLLLNKLIDKMRITKGAILVVSKGKIVRVEMVGYETKDKLNNSYLEKLVESENLIYIFEELEDDNLRNLFRNMDISIAIPLKVKTKSVGILLLGAKSSGDIYSNQDLDVLEILAPEAAVAFQNAQSYREIQEFNQTLALKVEQRTGELKESQKRELELKDQFVFIATHDLRTPVTAINGFIALINQSGEIFSTDTNENFEAILESSKRLDQLVNDLLQVARSDSGTIEVKREVVNIVEVVNTAIKQIQGSADKRKISISTRFDKVNSRVEGDKERLAEVMENLLSNAIKFSKNGGEIELSSVREGEGLKVIVADTGYGIPKDKQTRVFEKFFKARGKDTRGVPGTGLGLFVVKMLIEKMDGQVQFESKEGEGTTFIFTLPVAKG